MLPNFIVIGAAKCGTTSVCDILGRHRDVFMCDPKEPCFFSHMNQEFRTRPWYESLFAGAVGKHAIGEGSTAYTHPDVIRTTAERIRDTLPGCRLIYMVRHPIKRLESDWRMRRHEQWTPPAISDAVAEQPNLVRHGFYWQNLSVYREFFADEQILVVFFEDFVANPHSELERCLLHIGVEPTVPTDDPGRARNRSADFRADGRLAARLRRSPYFRRVVDALPTRFVQAAKLLLTRQEEFHIDWRPDTLSAISEQLAADASRFLAHCGKPDDYWTFETRPLSTHT
jgi:hypothetical protein